MLCVTRLRDDSGQFSTTCRIVRRSCRSCTELCTVSRNTLSDLCLQISRRFSGINLSATSFFLSSYCCIMKDISEKETKQGTKYFNASAHICMDGSPWLSKACAKIKISSQNVIAWCQAESEQVLRLHCGAQSRQESKKQTSLEHFNVQFLA